MKTFLLLVLIASSVMVAGCGRTWNALNRSALEADITSLLNSCGIEGRIPEHCSMIDTTREGRCEIELTMEEVASLVEHIGLEEIDRDQPDHLALLNRLKEISLSSFDHDGPEGPQAWVVLGRPPALKLKSGSSFEYLLIVYDPSATRASLLVSYAYG